MIVGKIMIRIKHKKKAQIYLRILNFIFNWLFKLIEYVKVSITSSNLKHLGDGVEFDANIWINYPENISIGDETFIGRDVYLNAYDSIEIGKFCGIAAGCKLIAGNHDINNLTIEFKYEKIIKSTIKLGDGVWLGYNVIILPGVKLGNGCVVAAGSVVTKSFAEYSVLAGVPAKIINTRDEKVRNDKKDT